MSTLMQTVRSALLLSPDVTRLTSVRRFNCLFSQGQPAEAMFIIEEGLVKQTRTNHGGDRIILAMCGPGDIVGEESLGAAGTYAADAEVLTPATLYRIPRETLSRMVHQDVEFAGLLIDFLLKRRQMLAEKVELLCLHDVEYRILFYLAELSNLVRPATDSTGYHVPITQSELADLIGATRETTSTTLNQLEKRGLLKLSRRLMTIPAPSLLRSATAQMQGAATAKAG
jgi:CRP/FNR family cyclic AMP-dependent transcriptional regulator